MFWSDFQEEKGVHMY